MNVLKTVKESVTSVLVQLRLPLWIEIITEQPKCTYYFGPFASVKKAELAQPDYIEDLEQEGAQGITILIKRCQPKELTIEEDEAEESLDSQISRSLDRFA